MAAKIVRLLSCSSSIVTGGRSFVTVAQPSKLIGHNFNWIASFPTRSSARMASTASNGAEVDASKTSTDASIQPETIELEPSNVPSTESTVNLEETPKKDEAVKPETTSSSTDTSTTNQETRGPRVRKIKAAVLLSYSGQGYFGMQMQNNGTRTIENDLMKAVFDAGFVDKEGFEKPKSIKFQRAARTDKNVSAARNIISIMVPNTFDPDAVNKHLPDQIRVMDYRRVTKGFDSKIACCARTYLYMIPTFAFVPLEEKTAEAYRITPEVLENLRKTLKLYEGTKNFHNFTSRKKPTDPSAIRFIMSFTASEPFVKDGLEYVVLQVKGQSFMLHQIRKMIGLVVAMLRGYANEETMKKAFTLDRIDIPMAPGLGLMLGEAHYDHYNKKFGRDGIHEPLIWDNVADKVEEFCQEKIYPDVTRTENEEKSMFQWLSTVPFHTYDVREYDTPKGFGPIGKANLMVKKLNGDVSDEDEDLDDDEDQDDLPRKKQRLSQS